MKSFRILTRIMVIIVFASLLTPVIAMAQPPPENGNKFDVAQFLVDLVTQGGLAMLISGWVSRLTKFSDWAMVLQTWGIAIVLTFGASVVGLIPVSPGELWTIFKLGLGNGLLANILYKSGILDSILRILKAKNPSATTVLSQRNL